MKRRCKRPQETGTQESVDPQVEAAVVRSAIDQPAYGQHRTANELRKQGLVVSGGGVPIRVVTSRPGDFAQRLKALSAKVAQDGLILTEDQIKALERAREEKAAHGEIETEHRVI